MQKLTAKEAKDLVNHIGPSLGSGDYTYDPVFPKGRTDVCAVRRMAENGSTYGFDTIYLVWKEADGSIAHEEVANSRTTKDYIHIDAVEVGKNGTVTVTFSSGGSYSGAPWKKSRKFKLKE